MNPFCVVGSLNMDMVTQVERFPRPGETLQGLSFEIFPGGKGANQAVALARLGAPVELVGALGDDPLGRRYLRELADQGVGRRGLSVLPGTGTGTASIQVTPSGENQIVIVPGANAALGPERVRAARDLIRGSSALLLQLEIPLDAVLEAARIAKGLPVILDPAPARELPEDLWPLVSILTPNETEARLLTGEDTGTEAGLERAARKLQARGVPTVILKAGARGACLLEQGVFTHIPGYAVRAIDTVAAGDSFNAGLALALGEGLPLPEAVRFANATGALSTTREGAQGAMPSRDEVRALMGEISG